LTLAIGIVDARVMETSESDDQAVLTLACRNRPGIVAAVATRIFERGFDVREAQQYEDPAAGTFFMRVVFQPARADADHAVLRADFERLSGELGLHWTVRPTAQRWRVTILVSREHHCLADLVYRWRLGELPMDIVAVVANHPAETYTDVPLAGIPFHHLPVAPGAKTQQEAQVWQLMQETGTELVILARYMQILSADLTAKLAGRCINIHHSFLPGFKGARPYQQAHARGVKLVGATAHYVTADLDEGPIIEQDVERISHSDTPETLIRKGRDIERRVLARAVRYHLESRVLLNDRKTVVFGD
jgi:formyltetrahydrofolate deformylase